MKRAAFIFCIIIFSLLLSSIRAFNNTEYFASDKTVRVFGKVTDESGEAVPEAVVTFIAAGDTTTALTDSNGMYSVELIPDLTGVKESSIPEQFVLRQNFPNPFNPSTTIEYELHSPAQVKLAVYNIAGQLIRTLRDGIENTGIHSARWYGRDDDGNGVAAGVYLYRLQVDDYTQTKKMVLVDGGGSGQSYSVSKTGTEPSGKITQPAETPYEILVEKAEFETYREEGFVIPEGVSELEKDIILRWRNYFPLRVGNRWDYIKLESHDYTAIGSFSIEVADTTIIAGRKYFVINQNWNVNIPNTVYARKEGTITFYSTISLIFPATLIGNLYFRKDIFFHISYFLMSISQYAQFFKYRVNRLFRYTQSIPYFSCA